MDFRNSEPVKLFTQTGLDNYASQAHSTGLMHDLHQRVMVLISKLVQEETSTFLYNLISKRKYTLYMYLQGIRFEIKFPHASYKSGITFFSRSGNFDKCQGKSIKAKGKGKGGGLRMHGQTWMCNVAKEYLPPNPH